MELGDSSNGGSDSIFRRAFNRVVLEIGGLTVGLSVGYGIGGELQPGRIELGPISKGDLSPGSIAAMLYVLMRIGISIGSHRIRFTDTGDSVYLTADDHED